MLEMFDELLPRYAVLVIILINTHAPLRLVTNKFLSTHVIYIYVGLKANIIVPLLAVNYFLMMHLMKL